ncbi:CNT family concentrative nucleoside transporter [Winogradskyella eximia]|uniref:CNT family concentrative nucleoside transporter n=1 Tax=Winogradskyella eximia TaxID=262006 RepID=A0A3D9H2U0_9FLAO|nr:nucleoside transporter C-terminal domain-containing protein [Winogradskyella eximia]RED43216.1 CNT family concentrative nucleoside transporter [Winogradskyella eximia]|tara:strand:+ start:50352 stop:52064 length:1713 start_codon:yes stop_codon:yes gene_type:complete
MNQFFKAFLAIFIGLSSITAQELEKTWESTTPESVFNTLEFKEGEFNFLSNSKNNLEGDYMYQNNLLVLYHNDSLNSIKRYKITELTDSTLVFSGNEMRFNLIAKKEESVAPAETTIAQIIPNQGFSITSLWRGVLGMVTLIFIAFLFSSNRKAINWKTVGIGLLFQLIIAVGVLKVDFVKSAFEFIGQGFIAILGFTQAGSEFLFGGMLDVTSFGFIFAFQVLPTIIFFSALTSVLFYLGLIQKVVKGMGWLLSKVLGISGAESLSVAGNIFLGQTEAPLLIKAYLEKMNKSEILLVMIGGMATVAGAVLAAYIGFLGGEDEALQLFYAKHLLAASVMAAPGAIVISKILFPQTEDINTEVAVSQDKIGSNILESIANGTTEGLKLAVNVGAMLLVFVAFIAMINGILGGVAGFNGFSIEALNIDWHFTSLNEVIANNTPYKSLSLEFILGYVFAPLMWLIGVASEDMALMGQLLGIKLAASEFIGYIQLADLKNAANATHLTYEKSIIMATYMLCGFANFASIGIQIGGIGSLAPGQRTQLSKFGMKALIGGTLASLVSATIAGMIIG